MHTAKLNEAQARPRRSQAMPGNALVPTRAPGIQYEPPQPRDVAERLEFKSAAQYKKAVALAERYLQQAHFAVERRAASVLKAERQAELDHNETATNYARQVFQARLRQRGMVEQVHTKYRQSLYQARAHASRSEGVYREVLGQLGHYGELQLALLALEDGRVVTHSLVAAYKGALGPEALGDFAGFLYGLDRTLDLARDRRTVLPMQFADALLKAVMHRQLRRAGSDKEEAERLKQLAGSRIVAIRDFVAASGADTTPQAIGQVFQAVHGWLAKANGTPFDVALDRLKLDVDASVRREQKTLEAELALAAHHCNRLSDLHPVFDAYQQARRVLVSSEHAARGLLNAEIARLNEQLDKEIQLADAMVIGMDHTAAKRLADAKRQHLEARKLVGRWSRVLDDLEEVGRWQKLMWRLTESFDYQGFWDELRERQAAEPTGQKPAAPAS